MIFFQERPLGFLGGHLGDGILRGIFAAQKPTKAFFFRYIRWTLMKKSFKVIKRPRNILLASMEDIEEMAYLEASFQPKNLHKPLF